MLTTNYTHNLLNIELNSIYEIETFGQPCIIVTGKIINIIIIDENFIEYELMTDNGKIITFYDLGHSNKKETWCDDYKCIIKRAIKL